VTVPVAHVPDHTWQGLSDEAWATNLALYATRPHRFLSLQCEGECWCNPPDARANSWEGHGRGPTPCPFEARPFDEHANRALVATRQAQAAGWSLPSIDATAMLDITAALSHPPGWCECLPAGLSRIDLLPEYLARGWSFDTFPATEPAVPMVRGWCDRTAREPGCLYVFGNVGRGKTGLAVAAARQFLETNATRTAFLGRVSPTREELAGERGTLLAKWLTLVDLLILDDLDFGWRTSAAADEGGDKLASVLGERFARGLRVVLTAHLAIGMLVDSVGRTMTEALASARPLAVGLAAGPSLRTGRVW
jgi:hypothetical protein